MKIRTALAMALILAANASPAAKLQPISVEDRGLDGVQRIYNVRCPDGQRVGMAHHYKEGRICYIPAGGHETCRSGNDLDLAAKLACQQSKPR